MTENLVSVRYMMDDVDTVVAFYTKYFGFSVGLRGTQTRVALVEESKRRSAAGSASQFDWNQVSGRLPTEVQFSLTEIRE